MDLTPSTLTSYLPTEVDLLSMLQFILIFAAAALLLGIFGRVILGKLSDLNHAVSSAMGIFCIYAVTIVVYIFNPGDLADFLSPLPFVSFSGEYMTLFSFQSAEFTAICSQLLSMVILAFLVNLLDSWIPEEERIISWYLYRFLSVILSMVLHFIISWLFNTYLPGTLVTYAPMILLIILAAMMLIGVLKVLLGLVLTVVNPIIGAVYTFFFASKIGKQISKAVMTTTILTAVVILLEHLGYTVICIASTALTAYIPLIIVMLILWYLIGHIL